MNDTPIYDEYIQVAKMLREEREKPLCNMFLYIQHLKKGVDFHFAKLPPNDKTVLLLAGLKENGFVSSDTTIEHFRVIFGIPLHKSNTPFEPIKWRKNKQLLRFFIYSLFPKETLLFHGRAVFMLFADLHGSHTNIPKADKKRMESSADYETLKNLLNNFNE